MRYIEALEKALGKKATMHFLPMQKGDVADTWADCAAIANAIGFAPKISVEEGIGHFVAWYRHFYR